ncbi:hypothetical protein PRVXH_002433 [Proteinivorax hydrogeniformans]|uniref:Uncharacterized protein n=1 Tax=Proteinivorax hydrogeniformans TaxID=1826727 RepID=A0AAU8HTR7_9FIRM
MKKELKGIFEKKDMIIVLDIFKETAAPVRRALDDIKNLLDPCAILFMTDKGQEDA